MIHYFKLFLNDTLSNASLTFIWDHIEPKQEYLSQLSKHLSGYKY